jgi:hypothetical protein
MPWRLFSLTAAGQPRNFTGFPFEPGHAPRHQHTPNLFAGRAFVNPNGAPTRARVGGAHGLHLLRSLRARQC